MEWNDFFVGLFTFLFWACLIDIFALNGLFTSAIATRIRGKEEE